MMSSCKKDELISGYDVTTIDTITTNKVIEIKKKGRPLPKKRKFRLFKRKPDKVPKSSRKTS